MRKSGELDFKVEGRREEVQKEREEAVNWTLRRRGGVRKSKRSEKEWQIGLCGSGKMRGSPKGVGAQERKTRHHICAKNI